MKQYDSSKESKFTVYLDANIYMVGQWGNIFHMVDLNG